MPDYARIMKRALEVAEQGIAAGESPFGAVIARDDGTVIIAAHNTVRSEQDATAHAEINAIRGACRKLGTIDLTGHVIATTCEPCPMCATAIHWARLDAVIYGAVIDDARNAGFNELSIPCRVLYREGGSRVRVHAGLMQDECKALFARWTQGPNATAY